MSKSLTMQACPKYQVCNAPICPLDPDWHKRKHLPADKACFYLLESAKTDSKAIFDSAGRGNLYEAIVRQAPDIIATHSTLKHTYERAKKTGSRMTRKFEGKHHAE